MDVEIISTGHEIVSGAVVDSNAAYMARELNAAGLAVVRHTGVGDVMGNLVSVLKEVSLRTDVAVVTGGLGPTYDDMTAEAAALAAEVSLKHDKEAEECVRAFFRKRKIEPSPANMKQAMLPEGSTCINNAVGTAPGFSMEIGRSLFFFLPGVPHEMEKMLRDYVIPDVGRLVGEKGLVNITRTVSLFGLPEVVAGERLDCLDGKFRHVTLGLRAVFPVIQVKLYGSGTDSRKVENEIDEALSVVKERVGDYIFSENGEDMETEVGRLLKKKGATVAFAESCTGGLIAHLVTSVSGSSDYFLFSAVTYSNEAKKRVLGVSQKTIDEYGAVSEQTAMEMASGARDVSGADYAIATSGIAGPGGGSEHKPVGMVCIAVATPYGASSITFKSNYDHRARNKTIFALKALDMLRCELERYL